MISYMFSFHHGVKAYSSTENQMLIFAFPNFSFFNLRKSATVVQGDFFAQTVFFGFQWSEA